MQQMFSLQRHHSRERKTRRNGIAIYDAVAESIIAGWARNRSTTVSPSTTIILTPRTLHLCTNFFNVKFNPERELSKPERARVAAIFDFFNGYMEKIIDLDQSSPGPRNGKIKKRGACFLCRHRRNLSAHHIIPKSLGGTDARGNIITLCRPCRDLVDDRLIKGMLKYAREFFVPVYHADFVAILVLAKIRL